MFLKYLTDILRATLSLLNSASPWIIISYILAGFFHDIVPPSRLNRHLGTKNISALVKTTISGMFLPICSCGTIPLGIGLYYSGAYAGPFLAFITATPVINPIAIVLSYGLLGKKITIIYVLTGFILPILVGIMGNFFAGKELFYGNGVNSPAAAPDYVDKRSIKEKLVSSYNWVVNDFAVTISKYIISGMLIAGFCLVTFPTSFIQKYLGQPSTLSLLNVAILAAIMYVCAIGHIPFIAALIAVGASPGSAITFLLAGASTNIAELVSIYKMVGKRTAIVYACSVVTLSLIVGYIANLILMPGFQPVISLDKIDYSIGFANKLMVIFPTWMQYICSAIILIFFARSMYQRFPKLISKKG